MDLKINSGVKTKDWSKSVDLRVKSEFRTNEWS